MRRIVHNLDAVRLAIERATGKPMHMEVRRGRNQRESMDGCVQSTYAAIFTWKRADTQEICSFSYNDVLAGNVRFVACRAPADPAVQKES